MVCLLRHAQRRYLNADEVSVKGCDFIYAPRGQAGEYSALTANPYRSCGHACACCYVPQIIKIGRPEFDAGVVARPNFIDHLTRDAVKYQALGITE